MNKYKIIIFDWDGTLMDSAQKIVDSLSHAAKITGAPICSEDEYRYIIGLGMHDALAHLYPNDDIDIPALAKAYREHFYAQSATASPLFKGVPKFLEQLEAHGYWLAVATGKSRAGLDEILTEYDLHQRFQITRTADETTSKPSPHMLKEIMQETGFSADECLMVGDTEFDLDMASRAGIDAVGVTCGAHSRQALEKFSPVRMVEYTTDLLNWLTD